MQQPLPVARGDAGTGILPAGRQAVLDEVQPLLVEAFRGSEEEISHRLDRYLEPLHDQAPVLDLGSGRGELLTLLRRAGIAATGVEGDPALAEQARRRGLEIIGGDVLEVLREQKDGSWGAVTAIHLMEHLPPPVLLQVLQQIRRVLRPAGLLLIESPNPHTLRVGASLYWLDPTHQRPLLPETLTLFLKASGFAVAAPELLHPFPEDQRLTADIESLPDPRTPELAGLQRQLEELRRRLDELINGPRDFFIQATAGE
jgi:SAM-dependent methyltransferase